VVEILQRAIAEIEKLPSDMQEKIGRELLARVENLRALVGDLAKSRSVDRGGGKSLADLIGSVDGLSADLSVRKNHRLKATGYGRKRPG
jgi:hypothetical protein